MADLTAGREVSDGDWTLAIASSFAMNDIVAESIQ
jgi:hypothetical protein